jgi:hypothetical protein
MAVTLALGVHGVLAAKTRPAPAPPSASLVISGMAGIGDFLTTSKPFANLQDGNLGGEPRFTKVY